MAEEATLKDYIIGEDKDIEVVSDWCRIMSIQMHELTNRLIHELIEWFCIDLCKTESILFDVTFV